MVLRIKGSNACEIFSTVSGTCYVAFKCEMTTFFLKNLEIMIIYVGKQKQNEKMPSKGKKIRDSPGGPSD